MVVHVCSCFETTTSYIRVPCRIGTAICSIQQARWAAVKQVFLPQRASVHKFGWNAYNHKDIHKPEYQIPSQPEMGCSSKCTVEKASDTVNWMQNIRTVSNILHLFAIQPRSTSATPAHSRSPALEGGRRSSRSTRWTFSSIRRQEGPFALRRQLICVSAGASEQWALSFGR